MLTQNEMNLVAKLVALVDEHSVNGEITNSAGFCEQPYMCNMLYAGECVGFSLLGSGHFSGAFSHKELPGKVIKVGLKKEDSGAAYAAWCRANQHLEGVPVIHHIARHASCYTVVLDELTPFAKCVKTDSWGDYEDEIQTDEQQRLVDSYDAANRGLYGQHMSALLEHEGIYETCKEIRKFFKGVASFDLHSENIMVNPTTGKLVITDPVSFVQDDALDGFDVELDVCKKEKEAAKRAARERLAVSTYRHACEFIGKTNLKKACGGVGFSELLLICGEAVDKNKANLAIDQLRGVTIDLDKRLQAQFIRG